MKHYTQLDGIRALAALMVMFSHFHPYWGTGRLAVLKVNPGIIGHLGVSLFFVLSGFLITKILLLSKERPHYFRNFYVRRTLRIFPLYYGFLVFTYFVYPLIVNEAVPPFSAQVYYWFYVQDFSQTFGWPGRGPEMFWSLAVEEHFYLVWPLLVYYTPKKHFVKLALVIVGVSVLTRIILEYNHHEVYYFTFSRLDELAAGGLLAHFGFGTADRRKAQICAWVFGGSLIASVVLFALFSGDHAPVIQVVKFVLMAATLGAVVGYVLSVKMGVMVNRILSVRFLRYTGKVSYGLYVYHAMVFFLFHRYVHIGLPLVNFVICFVLAYVVAGLSYRYFETPFLRLKDRWSAGAEKPSTPKEQARPLLQVQE